MRCGGQVGYCKDRHQALLCALVVGLHRTGITQIILLNSIANRHRTVSPCVAAGRLVTVRTVIKLSYVPWWWGYTEPVSPRPPHLHRISSLGSNVGRHTI